MKKCNLREILTVELDIYCKLHIFVAARHANQIYLYNQQSKLLNSEVLFISICSINSLPWLNYEGCHYYIFLLKSKRAWHSSCSVWRLSRESDDRSLLKCSNGVQKTAMSEKRIYGTSIIWVHPSKNRFAVGNCSG